MRSHFPSSRNTAEACGSYTSFQATWFVRLRDLHGLAVAEVVRRIDHQSFVASQADKDLDGRAEISTQRHLLHVRTARPTRRSQRAAHCCASAASSPESPSSPAPSPTESESERRRRAADRRPDSAAPLRPAAIGKPARRRRPFAPPWPRTPDQASPGSITWALIARLDPQGAALRHRRLDAQDIDLRHAEERTRAGVAARGHQHADLGVAARDDAVKRGDDLLEAGQITQPLHVGLAVADDGFPALDDGLPGVEVGLAARDLGLGRCQLGVAGIAIAHGAFVFLARRRSAIQQARRSDSPG